MIGRNQKLERFEYDNSLVLKRRTKSAILAEEIYDDPYDHTKHTHESAYFMLNDNLPYKEILGSKTFYHPPKSIIWRPGGVSHSDSVAESNGRSFSVWLSDGLMETVASYANIPAEFSETNTHLTALLFRLLHEFRNWSDSSLLITEGLILELFGHATRKNLRTEKVPPSWLERTVQKMEDEFTEKHTNGSLALEAGVHPVYLARMFRKFFGCSTGEYIKSKRVSHAANLLIDTEQSLAAIGYASGFSDQSQFTRAFKETFGVTPGRYRKEITGRRIA